MTTTNILPPPFAWCAIPAGIVTLENNLTFEVASFDMAVLFFSPLLERSAKLHGNSDRGWV